MYFSVAVGSGAFVTSLIVSLIAGKFFLFTIKPLVVPCISHRQPESHQNKHATPTMAGLVFISACLLTLVLYAAWSVPVLLIVATGSVFCLLGMWDDWCKVNHKQGILAKTKFSGQIALATLLAIGWYAWVPEKVLLLPGLGSWELGWGMIPWAIWIMLSTTNAVNLTDGLDGLATQCALITVGAYAFVLAVSGGLTDSLVVLIGALLGSLVGFLWYNKYPARMFMGDTGSLALGGMIAMLALISRYEILLPVIGAVFVAEVVSVILQVVSFRVRGKRLFRMAPLHHHFELGGLHETQVVTRFTLFSFVTSCLGVVWLCMTQT